MNSTTRMIVPHCMQLVQFNGSSTGAAAVQKWLDGEPYVEPAVNTRDLRSMEIETPEGTVEVQPLDWIVRTSDGGLHRYPADAFRHPQTPSLVIDATHLERQREWSAQTFGPGTRTKGVLDHIRKELVEIENAPDDVSEWIDVIILAFDGALRAGHAPQAVIDAMVAKQNKNEARDWPDWRSFSADEAIEHIR